MALYRETYKIREELPQLSSILRELQVNTGVDWDLEELSPNTAVFSANSSTSIEVNFKDRHQAEFFFSPRNKKNYFELSFLYVMRKHIEIDEEIFPSFINKKWKDISFFEKVFK